MKKIMMTIAAAAVLFAACDKIDAGADGRFVEYAGATANWDEGSPIANAVQRAFIEKYTGPRCPTCPNADTALNSAHRVLRDTLVIVSINPSWGYGVPYEGQPDMSTADGDQWATYIGGGTSASLPFGKLNRTVSYEGDFNNALANARTAIAEGMKVAMDVEVTTTGNSVGIDVTVDFRQQVADELTLTLALTEDSLIYYQYWAGHNPTLVIDYAHNHMLRDVITDVWGVDVKAEGRVGEARKAHFNYTLPDGVVKENCHIVAFVSYKETREILNCAESDIQ